MKIYRKLEDAFNFTNAVVTIGMFDGVHKGHTLVLDQLKNMAAKVNGESVVVTFWPHPRKVFGKNNTMALLTSLDEKIDLIASHGIDNLVILPFVKKLYDLTAKEFIENILHDLFKTKVLLLGHNNRIGKGREGTFEVVSDIAKALNIEVKKLQALKNNNTRISSSLIRERIQAGNIGEANKLLGYSFNITGEVVFGKNIGEEMGFPTANIQVGSHDKLVPAVGVYAVSVLYGKKEYQGMLNIGYRPTVGDDNEKSIEVNLFNFNGSLYGKKLTIKFHHKIRDERRFESIEALVHQLEKDKEESLKLLKEI